MVNEKIRIIPKIEIKNEYLIKGIKYEGLRKIGDPVKFAYKYFKDHADQINIIDIVASLYTRNNIFNIINKITENIFIPICVGGGIKNINDIKSLLSVGADRIIINSEGLRNINFLKEIKNIFGDQFLTVSIEAKKISVNAWEVYTHNGRERTGRNVVEWARECELQGAGEILLTSIDQEGTRKGFDIELVKAVSESVDIPVIASGGMGSPQDLTRVVTEGMADAVAIADVLHFNRYTVAELRSVAKQAGFGVRDYEATSNFSN